MFTPQDIEQAIQEYRLGQDREENFRRIDQHYRPLLKRIFVRHQFQPDSAEELTQKVLIRVYENLGEFHGSSFGEFAKWVFTIAQRIRIDDIRKQMTQKRNKPTDSLDGTGDEGDSSDLPRDIADKSPDADPLQVLISKENLEKVKAAIEKLPGQQRKCVQFRLYQGLSYAEIAVALNISVEAVKSHLKEGMKKLRALLRDEGILD